MSGRNIITIIGSVAQDSVSTPFGKRDNVLGGSATFSSISASHFQKHVGIVSVVGQDFPKKYLNLLEKHNVDLSGLKIEKGKTFKWKGDYNFDLNSPKTVYTHLNVFSDFKPEIPDSYKNAKYLFLANIDPDLQHDVLSQVNNPDLVLCDTMNFWIEKKRKSLIKLLKKVDIFLLNEWEARQLSGETNLIKAANFIVSKGAKSCIIKKGEHGVIFFSKNSRFTAPAYLLETIIDPTGAGDTFAGGLIGYLSSVPRINAASLRKSLIYGSIMATFAVEDFSVNRLAKVSGADIKKRYKEFCNTTKF